MWAASTRSTTTTGSPAGSRPHRWNSSTAATPPGPPSRNASTEGWPRLLDATPAKPRAGSSLITVSRVVTADAPEGITDFDITRPVAGSSESVYSLGVEGWVVPARGPANAIRVHGAHRPLPHAP